MPETFNDFGSYHANQNKLFTKRFWQRRHEKHGQRCPTYMECIFEEKQEIVQEMVDREAGQFWCWLY